MIGFGNRFEVFYVLNVQVMELFPETFELFAPIFIDPIRILAEAEARDWAHKIGIFARSMN